MIAICPNCKIEHDITDTIPEDRIGIILCDCNTEMKINKVLIPGLPEQILSKKWYHKLFRLDPPKIPATSSTFRILIELR